MALQPPSQSLVVENASMVPPGSDKVVVQDVSLSLRAGHGLGIIGPSGSGKSSLVRALVGVWRPMRGRIRLDGAALEQWSPDSLGQHVGYLPQDGMVFQSNVHTVGGVITAGDAMMLIVPDADNLTVEAKVNPQDIDQVRTGQIALLRLSAFNQRTTPEIYGTVTRISADASTDQRTGQTYYTIRIAMPGDEVAKLGEVRMVPGMPVEAFVQTGDRTMISYLVKPLHDQLMRMFREK